MYKKGQEPQKDRKIKFREIFLLILLTCILAGLAWLIRYLTDKNERVGISIGITEMIPVDVKDSYSTSATVKVSVETFTESTVTRAPEVATSTSSSIFTTTNSGSTLTAFQPTNGPKKPKKLPKFIFKPYKYKSSSTKNHKKVYKKIYKKHSFIDDDRKFLGRVYPKRKRKFYQKGNKIHVLDFMG